MCTTGIGAPCVLYLHAADPAKREASSRPNILRAVSRCSEKAGYSKVIVGTTPRLTAFVAGQIQGIGQACRGLLRKRHWVVRRLDAVSRSSVASCTNDGQDRAPTLCFLHLASSHNMCHLTLNAQSQSARVRQGEEAETPSYSSCQICTGCSHRTSCEHRQ